MAPGGLSALGRAQAWWLGWVRPHDIRVASEMLAVLGRAIKSSVIGPLVMFALMAIIAGTMRDVAAILLIGTVYVALVGFNHRRIQRAASRTQSLESLGRVLRGHVWCTLALAVLMAIIPWMEINSGSLQRHLFVSVVLVGYCVGFAFVHSVLPPAAIVFSTITTTSVAFFWLFVDTAAGPYLAMLILVFNYFVVRAAIVYAGNLRRTSRIRFERDDALLVAEENARKLTEALVKIRQIDEEKIRLFSAANHDLRQPISAISLFVGALEMRVKRLAEPERGTMIDIVKDIDHTVEILDQIVSSLSELTRLDSGGFVIRPRYVSLAKLVSDAIVDLQFMARARQCSLSNQIADRKLYADPEVISRILRNFIDNAIKYAPGKPITIHLTRRDSGEWLCVSDKGPGVADDKKEAVFEEYVQLDNPARDRSKGFGLGLPIARRLAKLAQCELRLEDAPGGGLMAMMQLDNLLVTETPEPTLAAEPAPPAPPAIRTKARALMLVDDDPEIRRALALMLGDQPVEFSACGTGQEALAMLHTGLAPDTVLLDNWLPDCKGLDLVQEMRSISPASRIVLVTGDTDPKTRELAQSLNVQVLIKPITAGKVLELIGSSS